MRKDPIKPPTASPQASQYRRRLNTSCGLAGQPSLGLQLRVYLLLMGIHDKRAGHPI